jgi:tRNA uridine 5-carboxymethylaminomethyl modification enzyme
MEVQPGDTPVPVMSYLGDAREHPRQVPCHITHTTEETHRIIREGLDRSPLYTGVIEGIGPRYCPSIEDKVVRFADKRSHQIFVEPEGLDTPELYPNGISTSLPFDVQLELVRSIRGFERAHITRPGYAIEYDFFDPRDLERSLETRSIAGLFFAGQINGTTGYEEAAAQGLLAGINAARKAMGAAPWCPRRDEAYLGVLVDDLTTLGTTEPYRMFTSRAEFRLLLREDNADLRLTERGRELGVVGAERWRAFSAKRDAIASLTDSLGRTLVRPGSTQAAAIEAAIGEPITRDVNALALLRRPRVTPSHLREIVPDLDMAVVEQVEIQAKYEGYIRRQEEEIGRLRRNEAIELPPALDYGAIPGLSNELKQKLAAARPATLAVASRIPGITPAALSLLLVHLKKFRESA